MFPNEHGDNAHNKAVPSHGMDQRGKRLDHIFLFIKGLLQPNNLYGVLPADRMICRNPFLIYPVLACVLIWKVM
jgi:hypothetical protein